jgi:hypothetical protein
MVIGQVTCPLVAVCRAGLDAAVRRGFGAPMLAQLIRRSALLLGTPFAAVLLLDTSISLPVTVFPCRAAHPAGGRFLVQSKEIHHGRSTLSLLQRPL